jgi:hypothetical protein
VRTTTAAMRPTRRALRARHDVAERRRVAAARGLVSRPKAASWFALVFSTEPMTREGEARPSSRRSSLSRALAPRRSTGNGRSGHAACAFPANRAKGDCSNAASKAAASR